MTFKKQNLRFLVYFTLVFIVGNFVFSFFETYLYDLSINNKLSKNGIRDSILFPFYINVLCVTYFIFSYIFIYKVSNTLSYKKYVRLFLVIYYILSVYTLSYVHYISPLSYLSSYIYNGIENNVWSQDYKSYIYNKEIQKLGVVE